MRSASTYNVCAATASPRLQSEIAKADLGAILLWDPVNMRYASGTRLMESFMLRHKNKSVLVPREGKPIILQPGRLEASIVWR